MDHTSYRVGEPLLFRCVTQRSPVRIGKVFKNFDPASLELIEEDALSIRGAEVATIMIHLDDQVVVDPFNDIPEMGRSVLEKDRHPVAGGIILSRKM